MAERGDEGGGGRDLQSAEVELSVGKLNFRARVRVTTGGLLAIGVLVSGILVSTSALVWTSTAVARRHPLVSRVRPR